MQSALRVLLMLQCLAVLARADVPQQALLKAIERVQRAQEQLAEAKASLSAARKRDHHAKGGRNDEQEVAGVKAALAELAAAKAEVIEAREAVRIEQRR